MVKLLQPLKVLFLFLTLYTGFTPLDLHAFVPAQGMFLVADEAMVDPRFKSRVILLVRHDAEGSAGLIVNRSSRLPLNAVLPKESQLDRQGQTLSYGGPVDPESLIALIKVRNYPPEPADKILANIYVTGVGVLDVWPDFDGEVVDYRAFVGYTGWAPGQLNHEIQRGDWHVVPADEESVFVGRDETLWEKLNSKVVAGE